MQLNITSVTKELAAIREQLKIILQKVNGPNPRQRAKQARAWRKLLTEEELQMEDTSTKLYISFAQQL